MGFSPTAAAGIDKQIIAYWEIHGSLPSFVRELDRGMLLELLDAIAKNNTALRSAVSNIMP